MPRPLKAPETVRFVTTRIAMTEPLDELIDTLENMDAIVRTRMVIEG